jgi:hypothetical protein
MNLYIDRRMLQAFSSAQRKVPLEVDVAQILRMMGGRKPRCRNPAEKLLKVKASLRDDAPELQSPVN